LQLLSEIQLTPDALVLDYQLGSGVSGVELLRRIRQDLGEIPVRLISADRGADLLQTCNDMGITLLTKPIDREKMYGFLAEVGR